MTDPTNTNDIDALLRYLDYLVGGDPQWAHAVRALVAERDAIRKRASYLEALSKPLYIPHGQRVESIDLRERLVCAIWPELLRIYDKADTHGDNWDLVRINARAAALREADAMIAEMRKGTTDGK